MALRKRSSAKLLSEINVTPFVDVMLVLLIVFMVTAPLLNTGVDVQLPTSRGKALKGKKDPLILTVNRHGQVFIGKQKVNFQALPKKLTAILGQNRAVSIYLRGDAHVSYGTIMKVMHGVQTAGYMNVALVTDMDKR